jgi:pSer/pThr/pTyr-binding forkhead associated (FHA) protein
VGHAENDRVDRRCRHQGSAVDEGPYVAGARPYNDIVIDNLAVSGEHAVLQMTGNEVYLEDLNSTNGTYINGKAVKKQLLQNNDTVEIGKYKIKYINEAPGPRSTRP